MNINIFLFLSLLIVSTLQQLYNHGSNSYRNQSWMSMLDNGIPLRKISILGTHSSMSQGTWGDAFQTQSLNLDTQLRTGIRALDIRCRHFNNKFQIHQRLIYLNVNFTNVLNQIQTFLTAFPTEVVLVHVVQQYNAQGNSRSFQDTYISYRDQFPSLIWQPSHQNPTLGQTRGKVVIIQDFTGSIHGLLMATFTVLPHKQFSTNWDQYDKWTNVKQFLTATNTAASSRIAFWTGSVGSFPYFVASGKSSPGNNAPRLATGLTTPGFKSYYPDFPRVACFIGICTIAFEGINILAYNYFTNQNYQFLGIVFTDFFGDNLITKIIDINLQLFGKCTNQQVAEGCTVCSKAGVCLQCDKVNDQINNLDFTLCLQCSSQTVCTLCDTYIHYVLGPTNQCDAQTGYYLDLNFIPQSCSIAIVGCQQCTSNTVCTLCSSINNFVQSGDICICDSANNFVLTPNNQTCICNFGFFINSTVTPPTCDPMPLCPDPNSGCLNCSNSTCLQCDIANNFFLQSPYCYCQSGYYYDGVSCYLCNITLGNQCAACATNTLCLLCIDNFTLKAGQCQCLPQFYALDSDTCLSCPIGCLECTSDTVCTLCDIDKDFQLVGTLCQCKVGMFFEQILTNSCQPCSIMPGCLNCTMTGCLACDLIFGFILDNNTLTCICNPDSFINQMSICQKCPQSGCLQCLSRTVCTLCDTAFYYLNNDVCQDICGDGKLVSLQCDDGNLINGDGCSSTCKVQDYFECSGGSQSSPSACSFSGQISMKLLNYLKDPSTNKFTALISLEPNLPVLKNMNFSQTIQTSFPYQKLQVVFDPVTGQVTASFLYSESLNARDDLQVSINPPNTPDFLYTPTTTIKLLGTTFNNLALLNYDNNIYQTQPLLQTLIQVLAILSLIVFIIGFFVSKLIAIQFISIYQLTFLGLIMLQRLQTFLTPAKKLWISHGYNIFMDQNNIVNYPHRISSLGYKSSFISNFNVMAILVLLPIIVGLIMLIISKVLISKEIQKKQEIQRQMKLKQEKQPKQQYILDAQDSPYLMKPVPKIDPKLIQPDEPSSADKSEPLYKTIRKMAFIVFKQYQLSALLFITYQVITSLSISFLYNLDFTIALGILILLGLLSLAILFYFKPSNFGQYKYFFHQTKISQNYYILLIVLRIIIGFSMILPNSPSISVCLVLGFCAIQLLLNIIIRPYLSNIRPILNSLTLIIVFSIFSVYGLNLISNPQWATTNLPIFIYAVLYFCLIYNIIFIIIHLYQVCKKKKTEQEFYKQVENTHSILNELRDKNGLGIDNKTIMMTPNQDNEVNPHQILKQLKAQMENHKEFKEENVNQLYQQII